MKNFKKAIFLGGFVVITLIYLNYIYMQINSNEVLEEDIYVSVNETKIEESNKIILHITGEVNNPRNYRNR